MLTKRVRAIKPSPTLAIAAKAKAMKAQGIDVISLSAGEPDFPTPAHIVEAGVKALTSGDVRYSPASGKPALRKAVAKYLGERLGMTVPESRIIIGVGAKQVLFDVFSCISGRDRNVILPAPYWVSFADMIHYNGASAVTVPCTPRQGYVPDLASLDRYMSDENTRAIILNYPHNPTGAILPEAYLRDLAALLRKHPNVYVISDETYDKLIFDGEPHVSLVQIAPDLAERTMVVGSFSKAYAMTGWRLGYGFASADVVEAMGKIAGASTSGPASFVQTAGVTALEGPQAEVEQMRVAFERRRDLVCALLDEVPHVSYFRPRGAFYVFVDIKHYLHTHAAGKAIEGSDELAEYLIEQQRLAVVPGKAFGAEGYLRLSFAASDHDIREGVRRLRAGLEALV